MKVRSDHRSEFSNLCNWKLEAWKKFRLQRDSNPWPPRYRCDALPTELWSHSLGARSIVGSHFPVRGVKRCKVYEIIHIWTADIDESEKWSSQWIFQFMQLEIGSLKKIQASTGCVWSKSVLGKSWVTRVAFCLRDNDVVTLLTTCARCVKCKYYSNPLKLLLARLLEKKEWSLVFRWM